MFIENKYKHWYDQLMDKARKRRRPKEYFERHHIIPKCMGGTNSWLNVVRLTFREHYLAHWLLTKFTSGKNKRDMLWALLAMSTLKRPPEIMEIIPSRWLERSRLAAREAKTGSKASKETRLKQSISHKGIKQSVETVRKRNAINTGKKRTDEFRQRMSQLTMGNKRNVGRKHTEEACQNMKEGWKLRKLNKKPQIEEDRQKHSLVRSKIFIDYLGNLMNIYQAVNAAGNIVSIEVAYARIKMGWPHREAVEMPKGSKKSQWPSLQLG